MHEKNLPQNPTGKPQRVNVPNPDPETKGKAPFTTAVVPPGSHIGHTAGNLPVPVFDPFTGEPLPGVTVWPT